MAEALIGYGALQARLTALASPALGTKTLAVLAGAIVMEQKLLIAPFTSSGALSRADHISELTPLSATVTNSAPYAAFVEQGTGIYGPLHRRITPVTARVLAWRTGAVRLTGASRIRKGRELAGWAFAKSVAGRPATPFFWPGVEHAVARSGTIIRDVIVASWNGAGL